ncbi:hypothetical protein HGP16_29400 [Rhizobium sp. P40RR-XXII]|uniref:hypothetical protein n=1 Tax=unclassified Rhizobium TaxID=2613769 RepID=UPI0014564FAE|nr:MULTISPECIES: hypothetical protein [unclassified Rhizobium]NLR88888.1 hypothetical protein [Rhizobium sp. P28RR-XV]NLS20634.1 hypothetical protein [Rhizobium sp. P40RR-XXII]
MKLPFERTPRNASTMSAKRTQKRRFFAKKAGIAPMIDIAIGQGLRQRIALRQSVLNGAFMHGES